MTIKFNLKLTFP